MLIAVWPLIVLIAGILLWVLASNGIVKEIGKWMFVIGLFFTVQGLAQKTVKVGAAPAPEKVQRA